MEGVIIVIAYFPFAIKTGLEKVKVVAVSVETPTTVLEIVLYGKMLLDGLPFSTVLI